ncbi:SDR family oxidoreductase [Hyphococcus luteus]|uniref:Uncharacterized protein n=1 Tax=Hyphococcus luteus TaxID=2058213 RepID=A0A2S7K2H4_9PROT|nr:NAD-dependent epimerase/dehydratase family protein [Marinicaulis flavus]PQA86702.1 hypothetical protein CW354_14515 [Marinicaulis flavus]
MNDKTVLVAGAGGVLGLEIVRVLRGRGRIVTGAYRTERGGAREAIEAAGATPLRLDLEDGAALRDALAAADAAIFTPILTVSAPAATLLRADQPAVFFSSNNVAVDPQAAVYAALREKEDQTRAAAPQAVILRPTMIYGYPGDGNLSRLMAAMRARPLIPIPAASGALQQPIYVKDLAKIAAGALFDAGMQGRTRAVAGPEPVALRALYRETGIAAAASPLMLPFPTELFAAIVGALEKTGLNLPVSAAQLARAGMDKIPQDPAILGDTPLQEGLKTLAAEMARP